MCSCNLLFNLVIYYVSIYLFPPLALLLMTASYSIPWVRHNLTALLFRYLIFSGFFFKIDSLSDASFPSVIGFVFFL